MSGVHHQLPTGPRIDWSQIPTSRVSVPSFFLNVPAAAAAAAAATAASAAATTAPALPTHPQNTIHTAVSNHATYNAATDVLYLVRPKGRQLNSDSLINTYHN